MINTSIGYIICESETEAKVTNITKEKINNKAVAEGIIQTANERNRNGRFYSDEELFPQLVAPRTVELLNAGYLRAEMGHPLSKELARQSTIDDKITCARFIKLWTQGNDVWATFTATNNKYGDAFNADLLEGCKPAWSLRALGNIFNTKRGAEVRGLRVITWDQVIYPSHPGAYTQRILKESMVLNEATCIPDTEKNDILGESMIVPITDERVVDYIKSESANLKFVRECFDFMYNGINVNESGTKVILTSKANETICINIENYIHKEMMRYSDDYKRLLNLED